MGVGFYLRDSRLWNDEFYRENYRLGVSLGVFCILRDLLRLESPSGDGDCTGHQGVTVREKICACNLQQVFSYRDSLSLY